MGFLDEATKKAEAKAITDITTFLLEDEEIEVISQFLPKQMDKTEVEAVIARLISESGSSSVKDMGKVMGLANKELAGKADGKLIAEVVKSQLA